MLHFPGPMALSEFRQTKLLNKARRFFSGIECISAHYFHLVDVTEALDTAELDKLKQLLPESDKHAHATKKANQAFFVVPRFGTISPWSSKATDIAHNCGLSEVKRIERGMEYRFTSSEPLTDDVIQALQALIHDRMTEVVLGNIDAAEALFLQHEPASLKTIPMLSEGRDALEAVNTELGLALTGSEIDYLLENYRAIGRDPSDAELMMFAQANSEHCRHKIFNARWSVDGDLKRKSLFQMIKRTYDASPEGVITAYKDNSSVIEGVPSQRLSIDPETHEYALKDELAHILMKVETHNHPTAISPFPGAATGSGGEIRDEAATGRGSRAKAGLCGFSVSNLRIPGFEQRWETDFGKPEHIASAFEIMLEGPIGAAAFNNEFGRPNIAGYFRTFESKVPGPEGDILRGYHKPIMIAGGLGNINSDQVVKQSLPTGAKVIVLGGPAMLIGLGGSAASSVSAGSSSEALDFASVQRSNPEMQRRCQEVIDRCATYGEDNPVLSLHDVGAGGLANAIPELLSDGGKGGSLELRNIPNAEQGMSPLEIWCNEAQERYVLAVEEKDVERFAQICERERCPYAVLGHATEDMRLQLNDSLLGDKPVDLALDVLFANPPRMHRKVRHQLPKHRDFDTDYIDPLEAAKRVLRLPAVASKSFLITIGDRSVGGLVTRDQMVGPWQVPVADVGVTASNFESYTGEALAMGERTPLAIVEPAASGRMAIGEALTNSLAADIQALSDIKLSANWMVAAGVPGEDAALYDTVRAVAEQLCPELGIAIPVGKDSMSMRTSWRQAGCRREMVAPLSLIASAFAPVRDIRKTLTPCLKTDIGFTDLFLIDLGDGKNRMGCSALAQVFRQVGYEVPDLDETHRFRRFVKTLRQLKNEELVLAYHDRSDGGVFVTLLEMAFASQCGITVNLDGFDNEPVAVLFNEELGVVIQTRTEDRDQVMQIMSAAGLESITHLIGWPNQNDQILIRTGEQTLIAESRTDFQKIWSETSYHMQSHRDNPECAQQEFDTLADSNNTGLFADLSFDVHENIAAPFIQTDVRPKVAILREQGVNGHMEMAAAFGRAGFTAVDVHMSDLQNKTLDLEQFKGLAVCGGFSYGDVLGAGGGWAKSVLANEYLRSLFATFFERKDTFGLGVCNGCQMLSHLAELIPGADHWPQFIRNESEQFEARLSMVEVMDSPSILLRDMAGSKIPVVVSHGEGRAVFRNTIPQQGLALRYIDPQGSVATSYPYNPNGSAGGITGLCNTDGRFTIMMPHPERVFRATQFSWAPEEWAEDSPWMRLFANARQWVG